MSKEWFSFYWIHSYSWKFKDLCSFSREDPFWNYAGCRAVQWLGYFQQWVFQELSFGYKPTLPTWSKQKQKKKPNTKSVKSHSIKYDRNPKQFAVEHPWLNGHFPIYHSQNFNSDQLHFIAGKNDSSRSSEYRKRMYAFTWTSSESVIYNNTYCIGFYKPHITTPETLHALTHPQ